MAVDKRGVPLKDWIRREFGRRTAKWRECPECGIDARLGEERCSNCRHDFRAGFQQDG
jgi:hypothetical protein